MGDRCMQCDFALCIYNENHACLLQGMQINALGMCEECIMVSIPDVDLQKLKQEQLENIEKRK